MDLVLRRRGSHGAPPLVGDPVTTMIVLVKLKEGVSPEDYERWVLESYAPAVMGLLRLGLAQPSCKRPAGFR